jgi:hypothetical protein
MKVNERRGRVNAAMVKAATANVKTVKVTIIDAEMRR